MPVKVVHKFGGTSLADASCFRRVADIIARHPNGRQAVVVSAMSGVTNALIRAVELAGIRDVAGYRRVLAELGEKHRHALDDLVSKATAEQINVLIERDVAEIDEVLHAATLLRQYSRETLDLVSGYGEVWSSRMLHAHVAANGAGATSARLDARDVLVVEWRDDRIEIDWSTSRARLDAWLASCTDAPETLIITGFVAGTHEGVVTTLGRNGSDFSASIFAALLDASEIHIWTDVDGVMSANPRLVPEALTLDDLSYEEAMELAYFGAKVIHPSTMAPAVERGLPIYIRNTFRPELTGTRIHAGPSSGPAVKGLATVESVALINLEGTGMIGVPGTAQRLFGALREKGISVVMISQGSSEHSICFAVPSALADQARAAVERAFFAEQQQGQIQRVDVAAECSILAAVGDGMAGTPGIAAKFFSALGKARVSIRAIAQGSSERNISVVVDAADTTRALRAAHSGLYLSDQTLSVGIVGLGNVGAALARQLAAQSARLKQSFDVDLRVRALASSTRMLLSDWPIDLAATDRRTVDTSGEPLDLERLVSHVQADHLPHAVIIDCTASDDVARRYESWLTRGIHVVTPNKRANTADLASYRRLREGNRIVGRAAHYLYETTVGAALPIIQTLRDLIQTGDDIIEIEGILSGTLSFLFNSLDGQRAFSGLVEHARRLGYTEPHPRDDLSGMDVARKVVILAREMGMPIDLDDVAVSSLVPEALQQGTVAEFLAALPAHDEAMEEARRSAAAAGNVLRFVGRVTREGDASVGLRAYSATHPFARVQLTDNIVLFRTRRYHENPLVVQGPGAGPEVTAAGVFADLLRLASYLGAVL
ncbi:MAG TPA: bifunctional aspartate kinase/homoserine dehydrogenase I [Gemmatimonadaceae bacterium]|nr:bifunctional aspartate kinase/homoserine dehydrogenase I [Gemmatimonadaceae bacterium]